MSLCLEDKGRYAYGLNCTSSGGLVWVYGQGRGRTLWKGFVWKVSGVRRNCQCEWQMDRCVRNHPLDQERPQAWKTASVISILMNEGRRGGALYDGDKIQSVTNKHITAMNVLQGSVKSCDASGAIRRLGAPRYFDKRHHMIRTASTLLHA